PADRGDGAQRGRVRHRVHRRVLRRRERRRRVRGDRPDAEDVPPEVPPGAGAGGRTTGAGRGERAQGPQGPGEQDEQDRVMSGFNGYIQLVYVLVAAMFVVGLHLMNSPATARRGNQVAQAGMLIAIVATLILLIHAGTVTA